MNCCDNLGMLSQGLTDSELDACRVPVTALSRVEAVDLEAPHHYPASMRTILKIVKWSPAVGNQAAMAFVKSMGKDYSTCLRQS